MNRSTTYTRIERLKHIFLLPFLIDPPHTHSLVARRLTSGLELDSIPAKNGETPAFSITSGNVLPEAMAMFKANRANVKSMEVKEGSLGAPTRNLRSII